MPCDTYRRGLRPKEAFIGARRPSRRPGNEPSSPVFRLSHYSGASLLPKWDTLHPMKITSRLFEAYVKCPTKSWLLSQEEEYTGNTNADWVESQSEAYRSKASKVFLGRIAANEPIIGQFRLGNLTDVRWRFAKNVIGQVALQSNWSGINLPCDLETHLHLLERVPSKGRGATAYLTPIRFVFRNKLNIFDRLLVAYDAIVLSEITGRLIERGKIVHGENYIMSSVDTSDLASEVRKLVGKLATLLAGQSPPDLVLNRHCLECQFRARCRARHKRSMISACSLG